MMASTHGCMSLAAAAAVLPFVPDDVGAPLLLAAALVGGVAPDLDLLADHRKTLHYPSLLPAVALALLGASLLASSALLLVGAVLVGAAALHALADVLAGSAEREPWDPASDNGVYDHVRGRWRRPRRLVRYSGAPEDVLCCLAFGVAAAWSPATPPVADVGVLGLVALSGGYALVRRRLAVVPALVGLVVPARVLTALPVVRIVETEEGTTLDVRLRR